MRYLDLTLPTIEANLALDEALLLEAEAGAGETLRLWEWPHLAVVLGSACRLVEDVDEPACSAAGVPILRRSSGGGTVLLGAGCLCYSLVLRFDRHPALEEIRPSFQYILDTVLAALGVPGAFHAGISDLAIAGRKFSGNAQQRKRHHLLHHGTLLHSFPLADLARYLRLPPRQPDYRAGRGHDDFVRNLDLPAAVIRQRLRDAWQAAEEAQDWPRQRVEALVAQKYASAEWARRR
jgi:lipoate-protein ligase A